MLEWINDLEIWWKILMTAVVAAAFFFLAWGGTKLNKHIFNKVQENHSGIHIAFLEKINCVIIVIFCIILAISVFSGAKTIWQTVFGGTALVSAVLAFTAQDIIKDILAGLMISIYKPFDIGDRITLEDGTAGVVDNITLRHVVLISLDELRIIVPNSKLNAMQINNYSHEYDLNSVQCRFSVSYGSNMEKVKKVIYEAVEKSEYSVPGARSEDGSPCYGPVYFIAFADSALVMAVTVFFERSEDPEIIISDINTRVREALIANNIEIPYKYVNVVAVPDKKG